MLLLGLLRKLRSRLVLLLHSLLAELRCQQLRHSIVGRSQHTLARGCVAYGVRIQIHTGDSNVVAWALGTGLRSDRQPRADAGPGRQSVRPARARHNGTSHGIERLTIETVRKVHVRKNQNDKSLPALRIRLRR